jgi:hypothetical protein
MAAGESSRPPRRAPAPRRTSPSSRRGRPRLRRPGRRRGGAPGRRLRGHATARSTYQFIDTTYRHHLISLAQRLPRHPLRRVPRRALRSRSRSSASAPFRSCKKVARQPRSSYRGVGDINGHCRTSSLFSPRQRGALAASLQLQPPERPPPEDEDGGAGERGESHGIKPPLAVEAIVVIIAPERRQKARRGEHHRQDGLRANWNTWLPQIRPHVTPDPGVTPDTTPYAGNTFKKADLENIPLAICRSESRSGWEPATWRGEHRLLRSRGSRSRRTANCDCV